MSRKEFFLLGLFLGMSAVAWCWGVRTIEHENNSYFEGQAVIEGQDRAAVRKMVMADSLCR